MSMWVFNRGVNPELTQEALESFFLLALKESRKQIKVVLFIYLFIYVFIYLFIYFSLPRISPGAHSLKKKPGEPEHKIETTGKWISTINVPKVDT